MPIQVTLDFPVELEAKLRREVANLDADVKEAYALELFRRGEITHFELSRALGLDRLETDTYLKRRHVFEGSLTTADIDADRQTLSRVMSAGS